MTLALLFPRFLHPAIEERYACWQGEMLIRKHAPDAEVHHYDPTRPLSKTIHGLQADFMLVVTDPLLVPTPELPARLMRALETRTDAAAAVPVSNESSHPQQRVGPPRNYLTLSQFQDVAAEVAASSHQREMVNWDSSDPGVFLARTHQFADTEAVPNQSLQGRPVVLDRSTYIHRFPSHRGQLRGDLLERIDPAAKTILEFGCGEAALGAALKARQSCRVIGIELDPDAAATARKRIDAVLVGDVRDVIYKLKERFEWIVGGDILEHLDEPWTFLMELKKVSAPGGHLILSLPNIASWPIINDLLRGRFDYVYMGILCAGHLRFFTRQSIEEMLAIAGWTVVSIEPQELFLGKEFDQMKAKLNAAGIEYSEPDLATPGYYVIARNDVPQ
jgi:SAM-dependent methyltransferase